MERAKQISGIDAKVITPSDGGHYFFGYYDLQPFDSTGRYHLCHKVGFEGRIPEADEVCELGVIDLKTNEFIKYAETNAWNFQQGAFLRWYKDDDHILFNIRENGKFKCCILNIKTKEKRILIKAIADVSRDGKWGVCINFSRIWDFRPGYGYAGIPDPYADEFAPADDGIFLMNMESGETKLIINYEKLKNSFPTEPYSSGKLLINHINFNPSGTRFAMLLRNFPQGKTNWKTELLTSDLDGNLYCMEKYSFQSHYNWKNDSELLIFGNGGEETALNGLYLYEDLKNKKTLLPVIHPKKDIHCLYSPNRRYIVGDGYPDPEFFRYVYLLDTKLDTQTIIGEYYSGPETETDSVKCVDARCDLHGRFDRSGRYYSFDSTHTGKRTICLIDMSNYEGYEF